MLHALGQRIHSVDASQNQPVIIADVLQSRVERFVRSRLANLNEGNLDDLGAKRLQSRRKRTRLMTRTPYQHTHARKRTTLARRTHDEPSFCCRMSAATPETAESELRSSD